MRKYYFLRRFERFSTQGRYGKGAGKFFVKWLSRLIRRQSDEWAHIQLIKRPSSSRLTPVTPPLMRKRCN